MTWTDRLEKVIGFFSPATAARRMAVRRLINRQTRERDLSAWEAADNDRLRGARWLTSRLSVDTVLNEKLEKLRERARESCTNDPYAASFVEATVTNTVGQEIRVQSRIKAVKGDSILTEENVKGWNDELEELWRRTVCEIGVNGESLHEIQQLAMRHWAIDGEIIIVFSAVSSADRPVPLAVQVIDPARLETPPNRGGDPTVVMGIERDPTGRQIVAYHFREGVVGDSLRDVQKWRRVPADRVCHIFTRYHADQTRGVPPLAPSMGALKDGRDYIDSEVIGQQVSSCYSVIVSTANASGLADANARLTDSNNNPVEEIAPGRILYKPNDAKVEFASPNRPGAQVGQFMESVLRRVSAGVNMPYELLAKDYSRTTYSSGRLSLIDGRLNFQLMQTNFVKGFLKYLWGDFVKQAIDFGQTSLDARDYNRRPWAYDRGQWMLPGWPWIDPVKDVQAAADALVANLTTLSDELATRGIDFDEWLERRKVEIAKLKEAGINDITTPPPTNTVPTRQPDAGQTKPVAASELLSLRRRIDELERVLEAAA